MLNSSQIEEVLKLLTAKIKDPKIELNYTSTYTLLVAVILSAQATDVMVNKITPSLFKVANTPTQMVALGIEQLTEIIRSIGLYRTKAKNIVSMSQLLISNYNGEVPGIFDDLIKLPGVGRKSANVILNSAFGQPTIAVDTHVFRVANRLGLCSAKTPEEVEKKLCEVIPKQYKQFAHHLLVLHGRYVCKAIKPQCADCILKHLCEWYG